MFQEPYIIWLSFMAHIREMRKNNNRITKYRITKNSVCRAQYHRNHKSYDCHLWYKCVKWYYLQVFCFSPLKFEFYRLSGGWKSKKWRKMTNFLAVAPCIAKPYMVFIYGTHECIKWFITFMILFRYVCWSYLLSIVWYK